MKRTLVALGLSLGIMMTALTAIAADSREDIQRQSLLRAYTRAQLERFEESRSRTVQPAPPTGSALAGLGSALSSFAANIQARSDRDQAMQKTMMSAVERGLDYPIKTVGERDAMKEVLLANANANPPSWPARKRLIEFALHLRPQSEQFFPQRSFEYAATELRKSRYPVRGYQPWALLTLAKLYLSGKGVPLDEGEALELLNICTGDSSKGRARYADEISCHLLLADMYGNNWGVRLDQTKEKFHWDAARKFYAEAFNAPTSDDQLKELFR